LKFHTNAASCGGRNFHSARGVSIARIAASELTALTFGSWFRLTTSTATLLRYGGTAINACEGIKMTAMHVLSNLNLSVGLLEVERTQNRIIWERLWLERYLFYRQSACIIWHRDSVLM